mgnify:CR=1 FL=1|nr:MAG TPA: hypothetical protein [Caudoviricetes sp.]
MTHRICDNGTYRDMTPEGIAALEAQAAEAPEPTPTIEERVGKVEEDAAIIRAILLGEEGGK